MAVKQKQVAPPSFRSERGRMTTIHSPTPNPNPPRNGEGDRPRTGSGVGGGAAPRSPISDSMLAIDPESPGGPEVLKPVERPVPRPAAGELLIRVEAAG